MSERVLLTPSAGTRALDASRSSIPVGRPTGALFTGLTLATLMLAAMGCAEGGSVEPPPTTSGSGGGGAGGQGGGDTTGGTGGDAGGPGCGDGMIGPAEDCDSGNLGAATCEIALGPGATGTLACGSDCKFDTSACEAPPNCGNDTLDPGEDCDGALSGGATCADILGPGSMGTVVCGATCAYDASGCSAPQGCGDGIKNGMEECDGNDKGAATCASALGAPDAAGQLGCNMNCSFDTSACTFCGDGTKNGLEDCDGGDVGGATCSSVLVDNSATGTVTCNNNCTYNTNQCSYCGDGTKDPNEACDGNDFGTATCANQTGWANATGNLTCTNNCTITTPQCQACGNGYLESGEQCDDGNFQSGDGCDSCFVVCLPSEHQLGLNCYWDATGSDVTWSQANANCSSALGGQLVSIHSVNELNFVFWTVMDTSDTEPRWIGLNDIASEGTFTWTSGEPYTFGAWLSGEPNNSGNEDCIEHDFQTNGWNDEGCSTGRPYICEYPPPVLYP